MYRERGEKLLLIPLTVLYVLVTERELSVFGSLPIFGALTIYSVHKFYSEQDLPIAIHEEATREEAQPSAPTTGGTVFIRDEFDAMRFRRGVSLRAFLSKYLRDEYVAWLPVTLIACLYEHNDQYAEHIAVAVANGTMDRLIVRRAKVAPADS